MNSSYRWILCALLVTVALLANAANAANREAASQVSRGIRQHRAGQYGDAAKTFAEAQTLLPEELRIAFDRGCALAAQGELGEARDLFQSAVLARDPTLTVAAHYNLGGLAVTEAKQLFGERPEDALPDVRPAGLTKLADAVQQYRTCLRIDPQHQAARHNLELLRLWIKQIQDVWARRDRERRRDELGIVEYVELLWNEQREIRSSTEMLERESDSPQRRRAIALVEQQQELLLEEIDPLRDKLLAEVQSAAGGATHEQQGQVVAMLSSMVSAVRSAMSRANGDLAVQELTSARQAQTESLTALDELYRGVAPFEAVLRRATQSQEELVGASKTQIEVASEEDTDEDDTDEAASMPTPSLDENKVAEEQEWVAGWAAVLGPKAQQAMQGLNTEASAIPPTNSVAPSGAEDHEQAAAEAEARRKALRETYEKAIDLGPQVVLLADKAGDSIREKLWLDAIPHQKEALRLLKEIAASMPPEPPQDSEQSDQQKDDQQQDQQDDKKPGDQGQENEPKSDEQQKDDASQTEPQDDPKQNEGQKPKQQETPHGLSQQQAEAVLRQAREREREYRERQKQMRRFLRGGIKVDRDW